MKTIEQEASNFAHKKINSIPENHIQTLPKSFVMAASIDGFRAGVEFAQKLISVKDELPPIKDETYQVLVKDSYGDYNVFDIEDYESEKEILEDFELNEITHWRLISFL